MLGMNNSVITSNINDNNTIRNHSNVSYLLDCGTAGGQQNPPLPGSPCTTPGTSDCFQEVHAPCPEPLIVILIVCRAKGTLQMWLKWGDEMR